VAVTAGAQLVAMASGTVLAILVVVQFGKGPESDGVFAAYGLYSVLVMLAQSVRVTMVARLIEGGGLWANLDRIVGAMLMGAFASGVVLVGLSGPLADLLVGSLGDVATKTARTALIILWAAASLHLLAATFSAALGALGDFTTPGVAYAGGGIASIAALLALEGALGIDAVATAVALGSVLIFGLVAVRLLGAGYRPHLRALFPSRAAVRAIGQVLLGALGPLLWQVGYVITLAFAARLQPGDITLYSYAFFAATLVVSVSSSAPGIVLAAPLTRTWDGDPRSLEPHERRVVQAGLVIIVPALALGALVGDEVVELLLGGSLGDGDAADVARSFVCLAGVMLASSASIVPGLAAFARGEYVRVAGIGVLALVVQVGLTAALFGAERIWLLAIASSAGALVAPLLLLVLVHGLRDAARVAELLLREVASLAALAALAFGPLALLAVLAGGSAAAQATAAGLGTVAFVAVLRRWSPSAWALVVSLRRTPAGTAPPPAAR
jgi:peptidoglycan biosynthesis protein MviN/MurJ (putative lipid II flippase)